MLIQWLLCIVFNIQFERSTQQKNNKIIQFVRSRSFAFCCCLLSLSIVARCKIFRNSGRDKFHASIRRTCHIPFVSHSSRIDNYKEQMNKLQNTDTSFIRR